MTRLAPLLLAATLQACAGVPEPTLSGVYSNISLHAETGDLGGVQMEVRADSTSGTVIFTRCEGGCYGGKTWPATIAGDTVTFSVTDDWFDQDGRLSDQTTTRYVARIRGEVLWLTSPDHAAPAERLKRMKDPVPGHTEELATFG